MGAVTPLGNDVPTYWDGAGRRPQRHRPHRLLRPQPGRQQGGRRGARLRGGHCHAEEGGASQRPLRALRLGGVRGGAARRGPGQPDHRRGRWPSGPGVIIGSGIGGINTMIRDVIEAHDLGVERIGPFLVTALIPDMGAGYVGDLRQRARAELRDRQRLQQQQPRHRRRAEHHSPWRRGRDDRRRRGGRHRRDPGRRLRGDARPLDQAQRRADRRPRVPSTPIATAS